jgi:hypothetical protein
MQTPICLTTYRELFLYSMLMHLTFVAIKITYEKNLYSPEFSVHFIDFGSSAMRKWYGRNLPLSKHGPHEVHDLGRMWMQSYRKHQ